MPPTSKRRAAEDILHSPHRARDTPTRTARENPLRSPRGPVGDVRPDKQNARGVLNVLLARGFVSCEELSVIVETQPCADVIEDINNNIRFMQLEVRKLVDEVDGGEYWALVNNQPDNTAKLATTLDELQLTFVKALLQLMMSTTGMVASDDVHRCLRTLTPEVAKKVTPAVRDRTLLTLVKDGWLRKQQETYYIGVRGYADLRTLIATSQSTCCFCQSTCILGRRHVKGCVAKIHYHCAKKWFESARSQKCPRCHAAWTDEVEEEDPEEFGSQQSQED